MQIDSSTVLLSGLFVKALIAVLFLVFWIYDRRSTWYAWWSGAFFFGTLAALIFLMRGFTGELFSIGFGVAGLITIMSFCWQGARALNGRRPLWLPVWLAPAAWLAIRMVPGFLDKLRYRVFVSSLLITGLIAMAAIEFWRDREEQLLSR